MLSAFRDLKIKVNGIPFSFYPYKQFKQKVLILGQMRVCHLARSFKKNNHKVTNLAV
jgi:hypothetical protein